MSDTPETDAYLLVETGIAFNSRAAEFMRQLERKCGPSLLQDAARYRKLVSCAVEGDWGSHSGWRLQVDIPGATSLESIDAAIDAMFRIPHATRSE